MWIYFFYNLLFPIIFIFFIPGLLWKLWFRPGWKKTFGERFGLFHQDQKNRIQSLPRRPIWIHAVSVGECVVALSFIKQWIKKDPQVQFILSTTTTTGQELARKQAPEGSVTVIFCPLDFAPIVRKVLNLINPTHLIIFETEIWPNMVHIAQKKGIKVALVNGRMSDKSAKSYYRFRFIFNQILQEFDQICVQTELDKQRFLTVCPTGQVCVSGNMKFDQSVPEDLEGVPLQEIFETETPLILLAASTHPGEEKLIIQTFQSLKSNFSHLKLVLVPRHAERGDEIEQLLKNANLSYLRRSCNRRSHKESIECLLADTTGEMLKFMKSSDIIIMGKSLAGHDEGHNLIEPALLAKPIITGAILKNFRFVLDVLKEAHAIITIQNDQELEEQLNHLCNSKELRQQLGDKAQKALVPHQGAIHKNINLLEML